MEQQIIREQLSWIVDEVKKPVFNHALLYPLLGIVEHNIVQKSYGKDTRNLSPHPAIVIHTVMNLRLYCIPCLHKHILRGYKLIKLLCNECSEQCANYIILVIEETALGYVQNQCQGIIIIPILDAAYSLAEGCICSWVDGLYIIVLLEDFIAIEKSEIDRYLNMKAFYPPFLTLSCETSLSLHHKGVPHSWYFILCSRGYVLGVEPSSCPQDAWLRITQS